MLGFSAPKLLLYIDIGPTYDCQRPPTLKANPQYGCSPWLRFEMTSAEDERTLVSWKEIASFLNRAERTVKRWERDRGLPVHRVPGGERGGVFAYPSELADWLKGKAGELEADDSAPVNPVADPAADPATHLEADPVET